MLIVPRSGKTADDRPDRKSDEEKAMPARRVVTAQIDGKGRIVSDETVPSQPYGEDGLVEVWRCAPGGAPASLSLEGDASLFPMPGGHLFRIAEFAPASEGAAPWMHMTDTVDYAFILEGELTLVMDEGETLLHPGDVVVQQGASHGWANRTDKVVRMAVAMVDVRPA
jgi:quercetin dioxygenase-like cupin family protein